MKKEIGQVLLRGLKQQCPACGQASVFEKTYQLRENCSRCGLALLARDPDTWFFMYGSTAALTGFFIALIFLLRDYNPTLVRLGVIGCAVPVFFLTMPLRKSVAIALDYLL